MPKPNYSKRITDLQLDSRAKLVLYIALAGKLPPESLCSSFCVTGALINDLIVAHEVPGKPTTYGLRPKGRRLLADINSVVTQAVNAQLK